MTRLSFERAAFLCALLFVAAVLADYSLCFQDGELVDFAEAYVTRHGAEFTLHDLLSGMDINVLEGDSRPRVVSYFSWVVAYKLRLLLWHWLPPHPSFTPLWLLVLLLGPWLLYRFLRLTLEDRAAALAGTGVYLVSAGCLSGAMFFFHPAKPLCNVLLIAVLYLAARIRSEAPPRIGGKSWTVLLALLFAAPFVDETAVFAVLIPIVWCPAYFWPRHGDAADRRECRRNWRIYLTPVAASGVVLFWLAPLLSQTLGRQHFDFADYLLRTAVSGRLDFAHLAWQAGNLMVPGLLPWSMANTLAPVSTGPAMPAAAFAGVAALLLLAFAVVRPGVRDWSLYSRIALLAAGYLILQTLVLVFHWQELVASGFYYGAPFSILFASGAALVYRDVKRSRGRAGPWLAAAGLAWVMMISAANVVAIARDWRAHSDSKVLGAVDKPRLRSAGGDWRSLEAYTVSVVQQGERPGATVAEQNYAMVPAGLFPQATFADTTELWRRWRRGEAAFLDGRVVTPQDLWLIAELSYARRDPPR